MRSTTAGALTSRRSWRCGTAYAACLAVLLTSCTQSTPDPEFGGDQVAVVGASSISADAYLGEIARRGPAYTSPESQREVLEDLVRFEVLTQRARQAGYDKDPELVATFNRLLVSRFREQELARRSGDLEIEAHELDEYYREHVEDYTRPEQARAALIHFRLPVGASETRISEVERRANAVLAEAEAVRDEESAFGALAAKHSDDRVTRYAGGNAGWLTRDEPHYRWGAAVRDAIFQLSSPGEIGPLVRTQKGFFIVKLLDRKAASVRPRSEVEADIRRILLADGRARREAEFYDEMRRGLSIRINETLVEEILASTAASPGGDSRKADPTNGKPTTRLPSLPFTEETR